MAYAGYDFIWWIISWNASQGDFARAQADFAQHVLLGTPRLESVAAAVGAGLGLAGALPVVRGSRGGSRRVAQALAVLAALLLGFTVWTLL